MKGGIFGTWFKELATLVLTQTVQAFLLAIVMGIVISAMSEATSSESGTNYAAGMLAIIALSQFGKIEKLVKDIFGVKSQFGGDMASGKAGLTAGKMLAMKGAGRLMDNGKKIIGGARKNLEARSELKTLREQRGAAALADSQDEAAQLQAEADQKEQDYNITANNEKYLQEANENKEAMGDIATGIAIDSTSSSGGNVSLSGSLGLDPGQFATLIGAITTNTSAIQNTGKAKDALKNANPNENTVKKRTDAIDEKIRVAEAKKKEGRREIASGVAETVGAAKGAVLGATVGLGLGDNFVESTLAGAGFGDAMAGAGLQKVHATADFAKNISDNKKQREQAKQKAVETVNQTIQMVQNTTIKNETINAKKEGRTIDEAQLKKIGEEAAKNTYDKLKNDFAKGKTGGTIKNPDGTSYNNLSKRGKKAVDKSLTEKAPSKKQIKAAKNINDISNI